ncbi:MAG: amidohydrolase [Gammaproteobacteria bacterium]
MLFTHAALADDAPDQIWLNARVITLDVNSTQAEALALRGDRIVAVGENVTISKLADASTRRVDLAGRAVLPGFIDAHGHFPFGKVRPERSGEIPHRWDERFVDLNSPPIGDIKTVQELLDRLSARAAITPEGEWVQGIGYDDTLLKEKRHPTRIDLDKVSTDHPIYLGHISGHVAVGNSLALELAGITANTKQPAGGHIYMDTVTGEPTGVLEEMSAMNKMSNKIPPVSDAEMIAAADINGMAFATVGVTTAQMGAASVTSANAFVEAYRQGRLPIRVQVWPVIYEVAVRAAKKEPLPELPDTKNFVSYGAIKGFADGSIQAYSGYLDEPYYRHDKDAEDYRGYATLPRKALVKTVTGVHEAGYQIALHGNGDAAIDDILFAFEAAQKDFPREDARHIVIHSQMATDEQLDRMAKLGVIPSFFNLHIYYWGDRHRDVFLGPERAARISALKSATERKIPFTLHADSPVVPMDPMDMVWAAVQRETKSGAVLGPQQTVSVEAALRAITINAARQGFEEDLKGSIEPGKLADLVVLDANPLQTDAKDIRDINVVATVVGGKAVYGELGIGVRP